MKLVLKKINLKEEIERDIESGYYDIDKFVESIKTHLDKANKLLENKILDLDEQELYDALKEVFDIKFDHEDYKKMLSNKNNKHYKEFKKIKTNMIDENGNNVIYIGLSTDKDNYNERLSLSKIDEMVNSFDFVIIKEQKYKTNEELKTKEKYKAKEITNIEAPMDENNELFDKALELIRKTVKDKGVLKQVLSDLNKYINDLMYQAKQIAKLSESDNPQVKQIGLLYKKALEENFNKKSLTQKNNHKRRY